MLRKRLGMLMMGLGAGALYYANRIEPLQITLQRTSLVTGSRHLPRAGLRVLLLADIHLRGESPFQQKKIARTLALLRSSAEPDMVVVAGDLIDEDAGLEPALAFLRQVPQGKFGRFFVTGNHDWQHSDLAGVIKRAWEEGETGQKWQKAWQKSAELLDAFWYDKPVYLGNRPNNVPLLLNRLREEGVVPLQNEAQAILPNLWVAGLDDWMEGNPDPVKTMAAIPQEVFSLLISHNPNAMHTPLLQRATVTLSGHLHGGQLRIPFLGPLYTQGGNLPDKRTAGWYQFGPNHTYISRGWGEATRLRLFCPPEITLIELR